MESSAIISEDGRYRVRLLRRWRPERPLWLWVMLNPSTAGEREDDATIRRLIGFTERGHGGGFIVENLFSFRETHAGHLASAGYPVGPDCDASLATSLVESDGPLVCAWGNHAPPARSHKVLSMIRRAGREPMCLGLTGQRNPMHPVRLPYGLELVRLSDAMEDFDAKSQTRALARERG
jgi:hypothetical protein